MKRIVFLAFIMIISTTVFAQQKITAKYPKATIAGKSAGDITINEIVTAGELLTTNPEIKITHFAFTLKSGNDLVTEISNSNKITDNMVGFIRKMGRGQKLVVEKIEATTPDGKTINLETLIFFIK
jgi:hypothetical protein